MSTSGQKRSMYGHGPNPQNVPGGPLQYPHNSTNGIPVPMQPGYGRPGPMSNYSRGPASILHQQQRQNTPPYANAMVSQQQQQYYAAAAAAGANAAGVGGAGVGMGVAGIGAGVGNGNGGGGGGGYHNAQG